MKIINLQFASNYSIDNSVKHPMFDKLSFYNRNIIIHQVMGKLRSERTDLFDVLLMISALYLSKTFNDKKLKKIQNGLEEIKFFFIEQMKILKYPFARPEDFFDKRIPWQILYTKEEFAKFTKKSVLAQWVKMGFVPIYLRALVAFRYNRHRYMLESLWEEECINDVKEYPNRLEIELAFAQACFERQIVPPLACLPNLLI